MSETSPTPFANEVPAFTVKLPLPVPGRIEPITELNYHFYKKEERPYSAAPPEGGDTETIYAVLYNCENDFGEDVTFCLIANSLSGYVPEMVAKVALAFAKINALEEAYSRQEPPLPLPDNPVIGYPLFSEALLAADGSLRLRGSCAGLRYLDEDHFESVALYADKIFYTPEPPEPPGPVD